MALIKLNVPTLAQELSDCCWHTSAMMIWLYWQRQSGRQGPMNTVQPVYQANTGITEVYAGLSASFFSGYVWYAPSGVDGPDDDEYAYLDLNADFPVTEATSVSAHVGYLEPMGDAATNRSDGSNDGDFDFGLALHSGDYFMALTYLEGSGGGFSTIVGYSWSLPIE